MPRSRPFPRSTPHPLLDIRVEAGPRLRGWLRRQGLPLQVWVAVGNGPPQQVWSGQRPGRPLPLAAPDTEAGATDHPAPATTSPAPLPGEAFGWTPFEPATDDAGQALAQLSRRVIRHVRGLGEQPPVNPAAATLGLAHEEFRALGQALGPELLGPVSGPLPPDAPIDLACHKMLSLLWASRRDDSPLTRAVAAALACASKEDHHLWVDLGLSGRDQVNQLIKGHFPALYRSNVSHVGWKKYLLKQIGVAGRGATGAQEITRKVGLDAQL